MLADVEHTDMLVARIAAQQRGRITTAQLHRCGLGEHQIKRRVRRGLLIREHHGVYAVAHLAPIPYAVPLAGGVLTVLALAPGGWLPI